MGYALFTARKMSLQAKVNDYNAKLMQLSNEETRLANKTAARQQVMNAIDNGQNTGSFLAKLLGGTSGSLISTGANFLIDGMQSKSDDAYAAQMNAKQKQIDTEKQRLTTLLNAAQQELQQVEKAEESA
nr:hypothetical protein [Candidatus Gastranaerophilales bacterium]